MKHSIMLIMAFLSLAATAQPDLKSELEHLKKRYSQFSTLSYSLNYQYFNNATDLKPSQNENAILKMKGNKYIMKMGKRTIINNDVFRLTIDGVNLSIMLDSASVLSMAFSTLIPIDSFMKQVISSKIITDPVSGTNKMTITYSKSIFKSVELFYDPHTYIINKITMLYDEVPGEELTAEMILDEKDIKMIKPKLIVSFSDVQFNSEIGESEFGIGAFISFINKKPVVNAEYKQFHFVSNL